MPLVSDHKCSSPEVYGADISPNMLCAGYFDCKADACQVSPAQPCAWGGAAPQGWRARPGPPPKAPQWGGEGRPPRNGDTEAQGGLATKADVAQPRAGLSGEPAGPAPLPGPRSRRRPVRQTQRAVPSGAPGQRLA